MDVRNLIAAAAMLAATVAPAAVASAASQENADRETGCVTRPQLEGLITYALPAIIEQVARVCTATLGPDAFLRASGGQLATRYRADNEKYWPMARSAVTALAGQDVSGLGEETEKTLVNSLVATAIATAIKPGDCGDVNEAIELLSPLPAENVGRLTAMLAVIGSKDNQPGDSAFAICPAAGGE